MDPTTPPRAGAVALYARLSSNPDGTKDSVNTQLTIGRRECATRWPGRPIRTYTDDDLSADDDTLRPGYEAMLAAIAAGDIGDVICRVQARISRGKLVWPRFQMYCIAAGITELTTWNEGPISLIEGEDMAGDVKNLFNVHHRVTTKLGVRNTLDQRALEGRPHGGHTYGYRHERTAAGAQLVIVPAEADVIRFVAEMILAGYSQAHIVRTLHERGWMRRNGTPWTPSALRRIVTNPVIAGRHTRRGVETGVAGTWEPILDPDTFTAARGVFSSTRSIVDTSGRKRTYRGIRRPARKYLLTCGLITCGLCGSDLIGQARQLRTGASYHYMCSSAKGGCGKVSSIGPPLEQYVTERYLAWVQSPRFLEFLAAGDTDAERRAALKLREQALTQRRAEIGRAAGNFELSVLAATAAEAALDAKQAEIDEERAGLGPLGSEAMEPQAVVVGWEFMSLAERRTRLFNARASVRLLSAGGVRGFRSERAEVSFGGQAPAARARSKATRKPKAVASKTSRGASSIDG